MNTFLIISIIFFVISLLSIILYYPKNTHKIATGILSVSIITAIVFLVIGLTIKDTKCCNSNFECITRNGNCKKDEIKIDNCNQCVNPSKITGVCCDNGCNPQESKDNCNDWKKGIDNCDSNPCGSQPSTNKLKIGLSMGKDSNNGKKYH